MVGAAVPERQLERLEPERAAEQLMAEADAVERAPVVDHRAHLGDVRVHRARVAGPVGEQDAVGRERVDLRRGGVVREHRDVRARLLEQAHDRGLGAVVEHDDMAAGIAPAARPSSWPETSSASSRPAIGGSAASSSSACVARHALAAGHGEHGAAVAQVAHERAGVETGERDDPLLAQPVEQPGAAVAARSCAPRGRSAPSAGRGATPKAASSTP